MAHSDLREDPEEVHHDMVTMQSLPISGKPTISDSQIEDAGTKEPENLVYLAEEEPELHLRTYVAWGAMILVNFVQVLSLQSPPSVVSKRPITIRWLSLF